MLDHLALQVVDVDAAVTFYSRVFAAAGVTEALRYDSPHGPTVGLAGPDGFLGVAGADSGGFVSDDP